MKRLIQIFLFVLIINPIVSIQEIKLKKDIVLSSSMKRNLRTLSGDGFPVVIAHGLGDSCFEQVMKDIENLITSNIGDSATCIPYGDNYESDRLNAYIQDMTLQVDLYATRLKKESKFKNGIKVIGFSHGTAVLRGYIQRYSWKEDYPTVKSFIAIHGPLGGVGSIPNCDPLTPIIGEVCSSISNLAGPIVYQSFFQNNAAQTNYYRHPCLSDLYLKTKFLPPLNKEIDTIYEDVGEVRGLETLDLLVLVKAMNDEVVYPVDASWFGHYSDGDCRFDTITTIFDTKYYKNDSFGLKTLNENGKLTLLSTPGQHLEFSEEYFINLILTSWG